MRLLDRFIEHQRAFARDDRAIAINLMLFALSLLVGAALIMLFSEPIDMVVNETAANTDSTAATKGTGYVSDSWDAFPLAVIAFGTLQLIAAAAFRR